MLGNNTSKDVFTFMDKALIIIIALRIMSGSIELTAAALMFKFNDLEKAFYINTLLALVGPVVLIVTTALALLGLAEKNFSHTYNLSFLWDFPNSV